MSLAVRLAGMPKTRCSITCPLTRCPIRQLLRNAVLFCLLAALVSCGFHLRGSFQFSAALSEMTLVDMRPATQVAPELRRALEAQGIRLLDSAPMVLQLHAETYGRRVLSEDSAGRAKEYALSYVVNFSLREADGPAWLAGESVVVSRDLSVNPDAVLSSSAEEGQLKKEMLRDAVNNILRRLQRAQAPQPSTAPAE